MDVAQSIGLAADERGEMFGTIEESVVLSALTDVASEYPGCDDLLEEAALRVQLARSAGVEQIDARSMLNKSTGAMTRQLRYRSEMSDLFTDLAIDVGMRKAALSADV